jgi:hypothetical protein
LRDREVRGLSGLAIDDKLELGRLLDRDTGRIHALRMMSTIPTPRRDCAEWSIPVVIGSSLLSSVTSFHVIVWANAQAQGSDDLDHKRDITLAIHAAIPDLIRETNRRVIQAGSRCLIALTRRFEWNSRAKPV